MIDAAKYEQRYAADQREQAIEEAVARALCEECYGAGSWDSLNRSGAMRQVSSWMKQARAAIAVVRRYS